MRCSGDPTLDEPIRDCVLPIDLFEQLIPDDTMPVKITIGPRKDTSYVRKVSVCQAGKKKTVESLNTAYHDIRKLKLKSAPGMAAHFDARLLLTFVKAQEILFGKESCPEVTITTNGPNDNAVVDIGRDDFFGVIAPKPPARALKGPPEWILKPVDCKSYEQGQLEVAASR